MSRGNITRRGKSSWRLKFELEGEADGKRQTRYVTVRGKRADAERELTRLLSAADGGTLVEPRKTTVAEYIRAWLEGAHGLSAKTLERYRELSEGQIIPHIGSVVLQRLRPSAIQEWHAKLLAGGGKEGRPLSARTVGHAHRVLHRALQRAVETEVLARNVASTISPPTVESEEVEILDAGQIALVLERLSGHPLYEISALALATGMRRGELLGLRWADIDLDGAAVRVERSLEETKAGLRLKPPKTKRGRRSISLPPSAVQVLRDHKVRQLEHRVALGLGKLEPEALVFCELDGSPMSPRAITGAWRRACVSLKLPLVMLHALRHTHASALIAAGLDVVTISRRLGHANPTVTLNTYAHLFRQTDSVAAEAIEAAMGTGKRTDRG
ncbi:site-specific integrase [Hyphomicrobium sp.]|uniref:site-specific integrase n=1 Tax=Hyphomicrobium sp. TaxID=82 RepID=UPI002B536439|nr:site-specific integrase [Hyphomicrobium sp.]HRQ25789.1 site-specific integrase [Hyphomicrobium sp.]